MSFSTFNEHATVFGFFCCFFRLPPCAKKSCGYG
jgi:hypothetical protein